MPCEGKDTSNKTQCETSASVNKSKEDRVWTSRPARRPARRRIAYRPARRLASRPASRLAYSKRLGAKKC